MTAGNRCTVGRVWRLARQRLAALVLACGAAIAGVGAAAAADAPGVFPERIVFGQSAALEGPARALGQGMRDGLLAAFGESNAKGGVDGRRLELISKDDGYEPERAVANTHALIESDAVFALIGAVGTPTSRAALPVAVEAGVPFIGPLTGAGFLRDRGRFPNVVNLRASYAEETEAWIDYLTARGIKRVAVFYQDDAFGRSGLRGVRAALDRRGLRVVARGSYARNLTAVHSALFSIRKAEPEAIVMVGAYRPAAEFIRLARSLAMDPVFINISFVGAQALAADLGAEGAGVIVSQVMPSPWDRSLPLIGEYQAALARHAPEAAPGFVSLEGYLVGRLVAEALGRIDGTPTREALLAALLDSGPFDLNGLVVAFAQGANQGMTDVFLTVIEDGKTIAPIARRQGEDG